MNLLIDENMPRSLAGALDALGFSTTDIRDVGLRGHPDEDVFEAAIAADAIIVTRDRGFTFERAWPPAFTAGVIFVNLPEDTPAAAVNVRVVSLLTQRSPGVLLGALTIVESHRALSRTVRRRR